MLTLAVTVSALCTTAISTATTRADFRVSLSEKFELLYDVVSQDKELSTQLSKNEEYTVFLSFSDSKDQAQVVNASGVSVEKAMKAAYRLARAEIENDAVWVKIDVVTSTEKVKYKEWKKDLTTYRYGFYRKGFSLDEYYDTAILEAEANSNGIYNYDGGYISRACLNRYLKTQDKEANITKLPTYIYVFDTQGYFCDENSKTYKLLAGNFDTGRRDVTFTKTYLRNMITNDSAYLASLVNKDGSFDYQLMPITAKKANDYNIVRHCGAVWNMIVQYGTYANKSIKDEIDDSIEYIKNHLIYKNGCAYLLDPATNRISLGGQGVALLAFTTYTEVFGDKYIDIVKALADGTLYMEKDGGGYNNAYKKDLTLYKEFTCVYYEGEAMYALVKAYGLTKDNKYIDSAIRAADYFISNKDYQISSNVHWMSYAFNEITKYKPYERFFNFGLKNIDPYLNKIISSDLSSGSKGETLMATFELYDRMVTGGYTCNYAKTFSISKLLLAIDTRMEKGLNFYIFPEYSMYFKLADRYLNGFAIREDYFRVRIDDTQHFMGLYCSYYKNFDRLKLYR